jgi:SAM-dependent methyltransferase
VNTTALDFATAHPFEHPHAGFPALLPIIEMMEPNASPPANAPHVWQLLTQSREPGQDGYFEHVRTELLDLFEHAPRLFVDVGCGTGLTGLEAKRRFPGAVVDGFEFSAAAAAVAATQLDHVHQGNVEEMDFALLGYAPESIDGLLLADVLEHLYNPWNLLVRLRPFLAPDAQIVASIPNARNLVLLNDLAGGRFTYEPAGLLDITHIRFFTLTEIRKMFAETGYDILSVSGCIDPRIGKFEPVAAPVNLELDAMTLKNVDNTLLSELTTIQFYVCVRPR